MSEHDRLAEIEKEYELMGCSRQWVDEYVRMSVFYPDPATDMPSHDGRFPMLPPGTVPHKMYTEKLESLIQSMEKAKERAATSEEVDKDEYVKRFGIRAYEQELRNLLTKFRPIDAKAFHEKLNALIQEEIRLLVNVRILEATAFNRPAI